MPELIWDGKYDKEGRRAPPVRITLPFQTVETVNESVQERQRSFDLFSSGRDSQWRNRLIWGDKKYVLPSLRNEFVNKVDLIYIDPPFFTGSDFTYVANVPKAEGAEDDTTAAFIKEPSIIEKKAYRDTWGRGLDSYLRWFYETAASLQELLSDDGSLFVHLDYHVGHYAKVVLDQVFGEDKFINEIAWCYGGGGAPLDFYPRKHDTLFWYAKGAKW